MDPETFLSVGMMALADGAIDMLNMLHRCPFDGYVATAA